MTIRQNPLHRSDQNSHCRDICASLASQVIDAIAAFTDSITNIEPCGFFFSTALVECIYHLIFAIQDTSSPADRTSSISSLKLSYQLLVRFSRTLDTAKRAIRALDSAAFPGDSVDSLIADQYDAYTGHLDLTTGPGDSHQFYDENLAASAGVGDLPFHGDADMSLFAFLDGAADEDLQYDDNSHQQTPPSMGTGFRDMMHSLDGGEALDNLRRI